MSDAPTIPERLASLRDVINNQNVNGLNAGQATAIARELDAILGDYGTEDKPASPPAKPAQPPPPAEPEPPRRGRRI